MNNLQAAQEEMRLRIASREPLPVRKHLKRPRRQRAEKPVLPPAELAPEKLSENERRVQHVIETIGVTRIYRNGWPDFAIRLNPTRKHRDGEIVFVKVKSSPIDYPTAQQEAIHDLLRSLGHRVLVVDGSESEEMIKYRLASKIS